MSLFERGWLFILNGKKRDEIPATAPAVAAIAVTPKVDAAPVITADDYEAWLCHLRQRHPLSRKPGMTMKDEYDQWMVARFKSQAAALLKKKQVA